MQAPDALPAELRQERAGQGEHHAVRLRVREDLALVYRLGD